MTLSVPPVLCPYAPQSNVPVLQADGRTSPAQRDRLLASLTAGEPGSGGVALLGLNALGTGFTANRSSVVVFAELHPTPGALVQVGGAAGRQQGLWRKRVGAVRAGG